MAKLEWDLAGQHFFETGVDHVVLFPQKNDGTYEKGVAWNGVTGITEKPSGADSNPVYADNIKYLDLRSIEEYGLGIEGLSYPDEFAECNGLKQVAEGVVIGQQARKGFGISWRSRIGNDVVGDAYGYKLHLAYNCVAGVAETQYQTVNNSPEQSTFSWDVTTTGVDPDADANAYRSTASITIDATKAVEAKVKALEARLYGSDTTEPELPSISEVIDLFTKP